ncbi:DTW domain-containing protein, partial [Delftia sp. BR1]
MSMELPDQAPASPVPLSYLRGVDSGVAPHAVSRLRTQRLARSTRPFL